MADFRDVDPADLRVPPSAPAGGGPVEAGPPDRVIRRLRGRNADAVGIRRVGRSPRVVQWRHASDADGEGCAGHDNPRGSDWHTAEGVREPAPDRRPPFMTSTSELQREALAVLAESWCCRRTSDSASSFRHLGSSASGPGPRSGGDRGRWKPTSILLEAPRGAVGPLTESTPIDRRGYGSRRAGGAVGHDPGPVSGLTISTLA